MELSEERVRKLVREEMKNRFTDGLECPKCKAAVTMVKFRKYKDLDDDTCDVVNGCRCLSCLTVYEEILQEVKDEEV